MPISQERILWNKRYSDPAYVPDWAPDVVLARSLPGLPRGRALDVGSGLGANSLFLAKRGYQVDAVDMSDVAVERLRRAADSEGVLDHLHLMLKDMRTLKLEPEKYDLVICFRFFFADLAPRLIEALKPGGALLCRAFTTGHLRHNPDWPADRCVAPGELQRLFSALESESYEETDGQDEAYALLVGRKHAG